MSLPLPIQERVLSVLTEQGAVRAKELGQWFPGVDRGGLDCAMTALMRANKVSLVLGMYGLVRSAHPRAIDQLDTPKSVPTAAEETAASLMPAAPITTERFECNTCHNLRFHAEFRRSKLGNRYGTCKYCQAQKMTAGVSKKLQGPEGECPQEPSPAHGTTSEPVVIAPQGNAGESLPLIESLSGGGDSASPGEKSACRPADDRGFVSARGAATTTDPGAAQRADDIAESTQDSADRRSPGGKYATPSPDESNRQSNIPTDPFLEKLAQRRARLVAEREAIEGVLAELERVERVWWELMGEGE